jgi:hypothetical protein
MGILTDSPDTACPPAYLLLYSQLLGFGPKPPFVDDWNTIAKVSEALRAQILCGMLGVDRITWVSPQAIKIHEIGS